NWRARDSLYAHTSPTLLARPEDDTLHRRERYLPAHWRGRLRDRLQLCASQPACADDDELSDPSPGSRHTTATPRYDRGRDGGLWGERKLSRPGRSDLGRRDGREISPWSSR